MTADVTTARINVLDPAFYVEPGDAYRWLREEAPVFWDPVQKLWAISRYDDIIAVEVDGARYSSFYGSRPHLDQREDRSIINMDDPDHQQQRNLVSRRFTPGAVRNHEEQVRGICREILDDVAPRGECEAIEAIASRLPAIMIGDLLGYPRDLWERVRHWSEQIMLLAGQTSPEGPPHVSHPGLGPVIQEFFEVTIPIIKARRAEPRDDLISIWATTEGWDTGHVLDETILVLNGGAETTRTVIGSMIRELALAARPAAAAARSSGAAVHDRGGGVHPVGDAGVEHAPDGDGRSRAPRRAAPRRRRDPPAVRGGEPRPARVRRPRRPRRRARHTRHVAFGFGTHFCLGAHVARLEIRVMFDELLKRIPDWELVDPDEPKILPATFARAYDRIRIRFTPS